MNEVQEYLLNIDMHITGVADFQLTSRVDCCLFIYLFTGFIS